MVEVGNHGGPLLLGLLVQIRYSNAGGQNSIVGMGDSHVSRGLGSLGVEILATFGFEPLGGVTGKTGLTRSSS